MRFAIHLILFLASLGAALADPPEIDSVSPDHVWRITARWVNGGTAQEGYNWDLLNVKTGTVYFRETPQKDEALPHRFRVLWSPDSHYVALNLYYGRAVQGVTVIPLAAGKPDLIEPTQEPGKPVEPTLLQSEDLGAFTGEARVLTGADAWLNGTDLNIAFDMHAPLADKKTGKTYTLETSWHKTVRFDGMTFKVIASTCDSYEKEEKP